MLTFGQTAIVDGMGEHPYRANKIHHNYKDTDGPFYIGTGSLNTPIVGMKKAEIFGARLAKRGYTLRSGHYEGCDESFEKGAQGQAEIYLPYCNFRSNVIVRGKPICLEQNESTGSSELVPSDNIIHSIHMELDKQYGWSQKGKPNFLSLQFYIRSAMMLFGPGAIRILPKFVLLWADVIKDPIQCIIDLAKSLDIKIYNFWHEEDEALFEQEILI